MCLQRSARKDSVCKPPKCRLLPFYYSTRPQAPQRTSSRPSIQTLSTSASNPSTHPSTQANKFSSPKFTSPSVPHISPTHPLGLEKNIPIRKTAATFALPDQGVRGMWGFGPIPVHINIHRPSTDDMERNRCEATLLSRYCM